MPATTPGDKTGARLVLKVDVDTARGLTDGVRRLADLLAVLELEASFFVAMGPDHSGRALKRLLRPGFLRKQLRSGAAGAYGLRTMLYGLLLPGPLIARQAPGLLNRLVNEGHEVGLHGWDHVFWHDRLRSLPPDRVRAELKAAVDLFRAVTGFAPAAFAAPGWQVTDAAYQALAELGISHASCVRGDHPFRPRVGEGVLPLLELPTTLPTLDEVLGRDGVVLATAAAWLAGQVIPGALNVYTLHGEVEGRAQAPVLKSFIARLRDQGVEFPRLVDAALQEAGKGLPGDEVAWGEVPGRAGQVAWQASELARGAA